MSGFTERSTELPLFVRPTVEHDHSGVVGSTEMFRWIQLVETFPTIHNVKGFFGSSVEVP